MEESFVEALSRLIDEKGGSLSEVVRRTNDQIAQARADERYVAFALMISPVSKPMLSMVLNGKRNIGAQELRKICFFGLGLSSEHCDWLEELRRRDRITQPSIPAVAPLPTTEPLVPRRVYALPDWFFGEK